MASLVSQPRRSVQTYWARRNYQRLGSGSPSRRLRVARLGARTQQQLITPSGGSVLRAAPWKKLALRLRAAIALATATAPARLLSRLRDAYVDSMVALAGRPCAAAVLARSRSGDGAPAGESALWAKRVPRARQGKQGGGDFERRMIAHIYSLVVTPELPCAAKA
ncbi:hypothetical protein ACP4OV_021294 [Aristida adscensionis]